MRMFHYVCSKELIKYKNLFTEDNIILPKRQTAHSCGYDFYLPYDEIMNPGESKMIYTGIKVELATDEFLLIAVRSSSAIKKGIVLTNQIGIIDCDYYSNDDNDGHIIVALTNTSNNTIELKKGDRIAQGIIMKYYTTYDDIENKETKRKGGFGSTN